MSFLQNYAGGAFLAIIFICLFKLSNKSKKVFANKTKYSHIQGPETNGITQFYLGNLKEILTNMKNGKMFPIYIEDCFKKYGNLFKLQIADRFIVYTIEPEMVKSILVDRNFPKHQKLYKSVGYPFGERFLGQGLLTETNHDLWKKRHHLFKSCLNKKILGNFVEEIDNKVENFIKNLKILSENHSSFDLKREINNVVHEIILFTIFGKNEDYNNNSDGKIKIIVDHCMEGLVEIFKDPLIKFKPHKWFYLKKIKDSIRNLRSLTHSLILTRIEELQNQDSVSNDVLTNFLQSQDHKNLDIEILVDDFVTFFIAGYETMSNTLSFCFLELTRNPEVCRKLKEEINQVIGSRRTITNEDLTKLNYVKNVFKETLRLWPVIPSINRITNEELIIDNIIIPKNTEISLSTYCAGRSAKNFPDPLNFIPERFNIDSNTDKNSISAYSFFPFSIGPRSCLGQDFSQIEAKIIIVKVLQNFIIELDPLNPVEVEYLSNLRLKNGLYCNLKLN